MVFRYLILVAFVQSLSLCKPRDIFFSTLNAYLLCIELCFIAPIICCLQKNAILTMLLLTMFLFKRDIQFTSFTKILQTFLSVNSTIHTASNSISLQFQSLVSKLLFPLKCNVQNFARQDSKYLVISKKTYNVSNIVSFAIACVFPTKM